MQVTDDIARFQPSAGGRTECDGGTRQDSGGHDIVKSQAELSHISTAL